MSALNDDGMGFATTAASGACTFSFYQYGGASYQAAHPIYAGSNWGSVTLDAALTSLDSGGFTLNWATTTSGININFLALGGTNITNATVKQWQAQGSTGLQSVTGVGFQPDCVLTIGVSDTTAPPHPMGGSYGYAPLSFGAMDSNGNQWAQSQFTRDDYYSSRWQSTSHCIEGQTTSQTALAYQAAYSSMLADGFKVNWTTCSSTAYFFSLCLKGGAYQAGSWSKSTSAASDTITVSNVSTPTAVLVASSDTTTSSTYTNGVDWMVGGSDGTNNCMEVGTSSGTSVGLGTIWDATHSIGVASEWSGYQTAGTIGNFATNAFTASYSTHDAVATEILFIAFGPGGVTWTQTVVPDASGAAIAPSAVSQNNVFYWNQTVVPDASGAAIKPLIDIGVSQGTQPDAAGNAIAPTITVRNQYRVWTQDVVPDATGHAITPTVALVGRKNLAAIPPTTTLTGELSDDVTLAGESESKATLKGEEKDDVTLEGEEEK